MRSLLVVAFLLLVDAQTAPDIASELAQLEQEIAAKEQEQQQQGRANKRTDRPLAVSTDQKEGGGEEGGNDDVEALRQLLIKMVEQREAKNGNVDASLPALTPMPVLFSHFDKGQDGEIDLEEFRSGFSGLGVDDVPAAHLSSLLKRFDADGDGVLKPREFRSMTLNDLEVKGAEAAARRRRPRAPSHLLASRAALLVPARSAAAQPAAFLQISPRARDGGAVTAHDRALERAAGGWGSMMQGWGGGSGHQAHGAARGGGARPAPEFRQHRAPTESKYAPLRGAGVGRTRE